MIKGHWRVRNDIFKNTSRKRETKNHKKVNGDSRERMVLMDNVNSPSHYTFGEIETIDYIRDKLTDHEFVGYCIGNVIKYVSRHHHKGGKEDLQKAQVYLKWAIENYDDVDELFNKIRKGHAEVSE